MLSEELSDGINSWSCRGKLFLKTLNSSEAKLPLSLPLVRSLSLPQSPHIYACAGLPRVFFFWKRADNTNICCVSDIMKLKNVSSFIFLQHSHSEIYLECFSSALFVSCGAGFQKNLYFQSGRTFDQKKMFMNFRISNKI